jgi:hypothetical protein
VASNSGSVHFFATVRDLTPGLLSVESNRQLQYILDRQYTDPKGVEKYSSAFHIPGLGRVEGRQSERFFVMEADQPLRMSRTVVIPKGVGLKRAWAIGLAQLGIVLPGGEVRYDIFSRDNRKSVLFAPGGIHPSGALVAGEMSTMGSVRGRTSVFRLFVSSLCAGFVKVKSFYVGEQALTLLRGGTRLTMDVGAAPAYDLRLENDYSVG